MENGLYNFTLYPFCLNATSNFFCSGGLALGWGWICHCEYRVMAQIVPCWSFNAGDDIPLSQTDTWSWVWAMTRPRVSVSTAPDDYQVDPRRIPAFRIGQPQPNPLWKLPWADRKVVIFLLDSGDFGRARPHENYSAWASERLAPISDISGPKACRGNNVFRKLSISCFYFINRGDCHFTLEMDLISL